VREIPVADHLIEYAVNIVKETRPHATSNENVKNISNGEPDQEHHNI